MSSTKVTNGFLLSPKEAKVFISLWVRTECTLEEKENLCCIAGLEPGTVATLVFMHRSANSRCFILSLQGYVVADKNCEKIHYISSNI